MSNMTADDALGLLRQGNDDFLNDRPSRGPVDRQSRLRLAAGQKPFAAYLSCSDSRVPPELLFGRGLGELFIVRNAGNTLDTSAIGSLEFAVSALGTRLIVVMGHEGCGAVDAAMQTVRNGARHPSCIGRMLEPIIPAVVAAEKESPGDLEAAVKQNVRRVVEFLREQSSPLLLEPLARGELKIVGAYYRLKTGEVDFFDS